MLQTTAQTPNFPAVLYCQSLQTRVFQTPGLFDIAARIATHSIILRILDSGHSPKCFNSLIDEFPHESKTQSGMIAYYQSPDKYGKTATIAKPGKYFRRQFPGLTDNQIKEFAGLCEPAKIEYLSDEALIDFMENRAAGLGLNSCMTNKGFNVHPYSVYAAEYGWKLAVYHLSGEIHGRALVNTESMEYVRTYSTDMSNGYNQESASFSSLLNAAGYSRSSGWKIGLKIARKETRYGELVAPYIDGCNDNLDDCWEYLKIVRHGEYCADNTDGTLESHSRYQCVDCGCNYDAENEGISLDHGGVCDSCSGDYVRIEYNRSTRRGDYYLHRDNAAEVNGDYFDPDYPPENVVQLESGDWCELDDAVYIESDGEYYLTNDYRIVYAYIGGRYNEQEYRLKEDCFRCYHNDSWYDAAEFDSEIADGETYCADNLAEIRAENQETLEF
jgi:hypothetical protein